MTHLCPVHPFLIPTMLATPTNSHDTVVQVGRCESSVRFSPKTKHFVVSSLILREDRPKYRCRQILRVQNGKSLSAITVQSAGLSGLPQRP